MDKVRAFLKFIDWGIVAVVIAVVVALAKALGKEEFLKNIFTTLKASSLKRSRTEKATLENHKILLDLVEEVKGIKKEVRLMRNEITMDGNGGEYFLKDAIGDMLGNQSQVESEAEAALYIFPIPTYKTDMNGDVTFVNAAYVKRMGAKNPAELLGTGYHRIIPDKNFDDYIKRLDQNKGHISPYYGDFEFKNLETGISFIDTVNSQLIYRLGVSIGTIGIVTPK